MRIRELYPAVFVLLTVLFVHFNVVSCGPAVRDKNVYEAEIEFMEAAADEQVERGIALIEKSCTCEAVAGVKGFSTEECQNLAETILVVKTRMEYHTAFMRFLGGLSDERPPEEPPEIPETNTLCPATLPEVPLKPPVLDDFPSDAGVE
jgi:hypothetical protein